jgi:hypothetical protein
MMTAYHIFTLLLVSLAMALSMAHALEFPGKLRLSRDAYLTVQPIYYPGFTFGGFVGELGGMVALILLLILVPFASPRFWWVAVAFAFLLAAHLTYWFVTHPVNGFWLKDADLGALGGRFFSTFSQSQTKDWTRLRDVWEYSHVARAVLSMLSLIAIAVSLTV